VEGSAGLAEYPHRSNAESTRCATGFYLPTRGPTATRDGILALAREGERLGLHSAMIADHIVFPVESESAYPYTLDGKHPGGGRRAGDLLHPGRGGRRDGKAAPRHLRAGVALPQPGAHGQDGRLTGCLVRRARHPGRGRRLAQGRIRGPAQSRFRAARRGDRRMARDLSSSSGPARRPASAASSTNMPTFAPNPSRCRSRIPRSGSAATPRPHCAARRGTAMAGTRSGRSPPRRCRRRRCARISIR